MRGAVVALLIGGCGRLGFGGGPPDATVGIRSELVLDRVAPGETLDAYPLLVILDDVRAARREMAADASDLRFRAADGTVLPHQIEQVGAPGGDPLVAWVRVPAIDGLATILEVTYGGAPPAAAADPVWGTEYEAVYHLAGGDVARDATTHGHDGVAAMAATTTATGQIGPAQHFDPSGKQAFLVPSAPGLEFPTVTVSAWVRLRAASNAFIAAVSRMWLGTVNSDFFLGGDTGSVYAEVTAQGQLSSPGYTAVVTPIGTWTHLALTADGATMLVYVDGGQVFTRSIATTLRQSPTEIVIGADEDNATQPTSAWWDGELDEIRIEHGARSAAAIAYDVAAMRDQVITYGAPAAQ